VPWRPLIVVAIFTGLRCSELRGLGWEHVDFDQKIICVRRRADFLNQMGPPKSEAGNRDVPMSPMVLNTLRAWKLACPATTHNIVFPSENGAIHSNSNLHKQCWRPLQRALGLVDAGQDAAGNPIEEPRYTFHTLRHAAASLFIEQGWSPKKVQVVMGHASIQVTFDTYGHLWKTVEDDAKAMAQIETRLLG
jgi:integrase